MDNNNIRGVILNIIANVMPDIDPTQLENLEGDVPLRDQLGLDSMDFLDIVLMLQRQYKIKIPEADYPKFETLQSSIAYLQSLLQEENCKPNKDHLNPVPVCPKVSKGEVHKNKNR